jgi:hypothetical protein
VPVYRTASVYFIADFNFAVSFFDMYLYITEYQGNRAVMNSNKEMYSVLKFTVACHVIVVLLAFLQWY